MTDGVGSEPSRRGGEALVFCTAQYKYLLRSEGWEWMGNGGLEQRDGAPPVKWTHRPRARSERWERRARPPHPPGLWGWERFPQLQHGHGAPPAPLLPRSGRWAALGGGSEPVWRHPMDRVAPTPALAPGR